MELTKEQQEAVESRGENLLIAAGAGAGKTRVLVERVVRLLAENDCEVDELLIVTFTNAAALEMRSRIQDALTKRLETELDPEAQARLERQIILLTSAQISTFHSFCQTVLRRNFARIDLDPKFRAGDTNELNILKREVIEELFEENYSNATFKDFTDEFGGNVHGDAGLYDMIIALHDFSLSMPYPDKWLDSLAAPYDLPESARLDDTIWFRFLKPHIDATLRRIINDCAEARRLAGENNIKVNVIAKDFNQINDLKTALGDWNALYDKIWAIKLDSFGGGKFVGDKLVVKDRIKALRDGYKKRLLNLRDKYFLADEAKMISDVRELHAPILELIRVTKAFGQAFAAAKRERGIIDFDDMEHLALKIFDVAPEVAAAFRDKFKFIMVDEYQDTNGVQEAIVQKISRGDNLFFVGDVKQSIYRFRLVDSANFKDKMSAYRCVNLSKNFRSRRQIIEAANEIFKRLMNRRATEIDYDAAAQLQYGANYAEGAEYFDERPEFYYIKQEKDLDDDTKAIELEMRFIAGKIRELIDSGKPVRDGEDYRPVQFKDIVILHRSPKTTAFEILDTLKKFGVPAYVPDEENYFRATEVQIVTSLLNLLDNTRQDIPLAAVMLSPIGGFSAEELAEVRIANPDADFYTAVSLGSDKCKEFLSKLSRWRELARQLSVPELLSVLYRETGYYDSAGRAERGDSAQANLRILIDRAAAFEATNARGLSRFVEFIGKLRDTGSDLATAVTLGENDNVVRVVTIHKSKGLEYPVVFVAGIGKHFNAEDYTRAKLFMHREFGIGAHRTPHGQLKVKTLATQAVSKKIADESLAEELRILYVAITRAEEKLFLVGTTSKSALESLRPVDAPDDYDLLTAGRFMDWLLPIKDALAPFVRSELVTQSDVLAIAEQPLDAAQVKASQAPEKLSTPPAAIPAKLSVTELKRRAEEEDSPQLADFAQRKFVYKRPNFIQRKEISGAEFGVLMHKVMQSLNISGDLSATGIAAQVEELARREIIDKEHVKLIRAERLAKFFASDLGRRLVSARAYYRELPFSRLIDAGRFFRVEEKIFIQGIIDLLFEDAAGRWVLLDYKTDRDAEDIAERYRIQIELYAAAAEALLNITVAEKYLYLLHGGRLVKIN